MQQQNRLTHSQFFYSRKLGEEEKQYKNHRLSFHSYLPRYCYPFQSLFGIICVCFSEASRQGVTSKSSLQLTKDFSYTSEFLHCLISNISIIYWILCHCSLIIHFLLSKCNYKVQRNHKYLYSIRIIVNLVWIFVNKYFIK